MERMKNNTEIDELLVKYLLGSASSEEREAVKNWFDEDIKNKRYFDQLRDIYFLGKVTKEDSGFDRQRCFDEIKVGYYKEKFSELTSVKDAQVQKIKNLRIAFSIAASLFLILGTSYFLLNFIKTKAADPASKHIAYNEIVTPKGARTNITLPDGTNVWLNAESRIKYEMDFIKSERIVYLTGEAFFDVAKSKGKVFIVNTGKIAVKAWGTKFNVKAYPEENTINTTLVEGSVSIKKLGVGLTEAEEYLKPNETAIYYKNPILEVKSDKTLADKDKDNAVSLNLVKIEVRTELFTSWKDSKWILEKLTLDQLAPELERRYNVEIVFEDSAVRLYKVSGSLENETFDQVLKVIKLSVPIDFEIKANRVVLRENKALRNIYEKFLKR